MSFEAAQCVFDDAAHLSRQDRIENGEARWQTLGKVGETVLLLMAHTWNDDEGGERIRIISARRATPSERTLYEQGA